MESALLAVGAIILFVVVMAVGYLVISRMAEGADRRRKASRGDDGH
jgi:hypothetical protein